MEIKFKPRFFKDINKIKNDKEVVTALGKIFQHIEKAKNESEIDNIKKLYAYKSRFRIKLFIDKRKDYRIGLYIHNNTVWFARFLHRQKIYEENW